MSYILNALRKSEQERLAKEADSIKSRISLYEPQRQHKVTKVIFVLVILNLAILIYFLGLNPKAPPTAPERPDPLLKPAPVLETAPSQQHPSIVKSTEPMTQSIADIVETRNTIPPATISPAVPEKSITANKITNEIIKPVPVTPPPVSKKVEPMPIETTINKPESKPKPEQNDLPTLDDLPSEFRRNVPDLHINVFSYSSVPSERFVMIDMVKYIPGQLIKEQFSLQEIRSDCIVVAYEGKTFKIKRP
jgi:general secretion pathway protein B